MLKQFQQLPWTVARLPLAAGSLIILLSGCAGPSSQSDNARTAPSATSEAPRLVKLDSEIAWENSANFGPVPSDLQTRGDQSCNTNSAKRMKAVGYHPQAMRLDGTAFPRGGFLCKEDNTPPAPEVAAAPAALVPAPVIAPPAPVKPAGPDLGKANLRTQEWAKAWASKDTNAYFAFYSANFKPGNFETVSAWKKARVARISSSESISVEVSNVSSKALSDGAVETQFDQKYSSAKFKDSSTKTLIWAMEDGQWKIISESNR